MRDTRTITFSVFLEAEIHICYNEKMSATRMNFQFCSDAEKCEAETQTVNFDLNFDITVLLGFLLLSMIVRCGVLQFCILITVFKEDRCGTLKCDLFFTFSCFFPFPELLQSREVP